MGMRIKPENYIYQIPFNLQNVKFLFYIKKLYCYIHILAIYFDLSLFPAFLLFLYKFFLPLSLPPTPVRFVASLLTVGLVFIILLIILRR